MPRNNSWTEYQNLVLSELERLDKSIETLDGKVDEIRQTDLPNVKSEIKLLKYKSSLWGGVAGLIPGLVLLLMKLVG